VSESVQALAVGAHELHRAEDDQAFDGAYSNLGALNCVLICSGVAQECARLLKPGGSLCSRSSGVSAVEIAYYLSQRRWARVKVRYAARSCRWDGTKPHHLDRYFQPREF